MSAEERQLWRDVYSRVLAAMIGAEGPSRAVQYNQDRARAEAAAAVLLYREVIA